ncbi:MAG: NUDIX hydrolase [Candidatus Uhrbacteria bacterium]
MKDEEHLIVDVPVKAWSVRDGRVLLVQEIGGRWTLPGGRMNVGETPQAALAREMMEEIGVDVVVGAIVDCVVFTSASGRSHFVPVFLATVDPAQSLVLEKAEIADARWIDVAALGSVDIRHEYRPIVERLAA